MTSEQQQKSDEVFARLIGESGERRAELIDAYCGGDLKVRQAVVERLRRAEPFATELPGDEAMKRDAPPRAGKYAVQTVPPSSQSDSQPPSFYKDQNANADPLIGSSIGAYRILEKVGDGGMGSVYKAEQRAPITRMVAIKVVKIGMDSAAVLARFDAERQALAVMDHPNIARVFDAGTTQLGRPYFVMELVHGEPITEYCDKHRLTTQDRMRLFVDVCGAVQHAHQKGIIHRDLKPSNILVSVIVGKPVPKVIDFGVAKATNHRLTEQTLFTEAGQLIGTPEYMSPEQAEMTGLDVDTRSDIYSLGVVLYQLLSGSLPFDPKTLRAAGYAAIQQMIRDVDPPRPSTRLSSLDAAVAAGIADRRQVAVDELARNLKSELEWIPLKAMHKDRTRRYRTATEMTDDIENYLAQRPLIAAPDSVAYRIRKLIRRNRGRFVAALLMLILLIAGIAGTTVGLVREARQRKIAEEQRAEAIANADEADRQTASARAVSQFLSDMLSSADPERKAGDKVTVVAAIEPAIKYLDGGALKEHPLADSVVRETIGLTYEGLGRLPEAQTQLEAALSLRRNVQPPEPFAVAEALGNLGEVMRKRGNFAAAEPMYREALRINQNSRAADDPLLANDYNNMALFLSEVGKLPEAEQDFQQALAIAHRLFRDGNRDLAMMTNNYGLLLQRQRKFEEAIKIFGDAMTMQRKFLPPGHVDLGITMINLAATQIGARQLDEASRNAREALTIFEKALPPEHPLIVTAMDNLGTIDVIEKNFVQAESRFRRSLSIAEKIFPSGHPSIAEARSGLGAALTGLDRFAEAEPLLREALEVRSAKLGARNASTAVTAENLAKLLEKTGRVDEAERVRETAGPVPGAAARPAISPATTRTS